MADETLRMPAPDDISDGDFQKACSDALDEHRAAGLPDTDIIKNFGITRGTFEKWANGTYPNPIYQQVRKGGDEEY